MVHRTTISLPDELKARMDRVEDVNWSRLCAEAIAAHLDELEGRKSLADRVAELEKRVRKLERREKAT